jgi:prepilin-type N-terminal cleavage/methylation domain-containing protein
MVVACPTLAICRPDDHARGRRQRFGGRLSRPLPTDQRGVTLVELMVAMLLLSIALVGMGAALPYGMYGVIAGGYQTTATLLAQQKIDTARNTLYGNLTTLNTGGGSGSCGGGTGSFTAAPEGYAGFSRCIDVQVGVSTTTVTVVVRFHGIGGAGSGAIYDTTLVTILAQ